MLLQILTETLSPKAKSESFLMGEGTPRERMHYEVTQDGMVQPTNEGDLVTHPWVILLGEWTERQGRLAKLAADLGLIERQVQVQEGQVKLVAAMMQAMLSEFGIDLEDPRSREIIQRHLFNLQAQTAEINTLTAVTTGS